MTKPINYLRKTKAAERGLGWGQNSGDEVLQKPNNF